MPKGGVTDRPRRTATNRRPERCPERGLKERRGRFMSRRGSASVRQLTLPLGPLASLDADKGKLVIEEAALV